MKNYFFALALAGSCGGVMHAMETTPQVQQLLGLVDSIRPKTTETSDEFMMALANSNLLKQGILDLAKQLDTAHRQKGRALEILTKVIAAAPTPEARLAACTVVANLVRVPTGDAPAPRPQSPMPGLELE